MATLPQLPSILRQRFQVRRVLGAGGFGTVLEAEDVEVGRAVAIKLLHEELADDDTRRRFQREARVTAALRHPHVVPVLDFGGEDGLPYIVYEFVVGESLAKRAGASLDQLATWGSQIAEALQAAHEAGIVHRDVKPDNVLIRNDGDAVLCDFGIARSHRDGTMVTAAGLILGTPEYMAPEVLAGGEPTPASDQFGLAATLAHLAAGVPVYGGRDLGELFELVRHGGPLNAPTLPKGAPPGLACFLTAGLSWKPSDRLPDLRAVARVLRGDEAIPDIRSAPTQRVAPAPSAAGDAGSGTASAPGSAQRLRTLGVCMAGALAMAVGAALAPPASAPGVAPDPPPVVEPTQAPGASLTAIEDAIRDLERGHTKPNGFPLASGWGHAVQFKDDLARHDYVRRTWSLYLALEAWVSAHPGAPPEEPAALSGWLRGVWWFDHALGDLEQGVNRGELRLDNRVFAIRRERDLWEQNRNSLVTRAEEALEPGVPTDIHRLVLVAVMARRLPLSQDPEIHRRILAVAEARSGTLATILATMASLMASGENSSPTLSPKERRRAPRRALDVMRRNHPHVKSKAEVSRRLQRLNDFLRVVYEDRLLHVPGDDDDLLVFVALAEDLAKAGYEPEVREALGTWDPDFLDPLPLSSPLASRPAWKAGLSRLRQLGGLEAP